MTESLSGIEKYTAQLGKGRTLILCTQYNLPGYHIQMANFQHINIFTTNGNLGLLFNIVNYV